MDSELRRKILARLDGLPGKIGFYYENLVTGERLGKREDELFCAASVIKLPVYAALCRMAAEGRADFSEKLLCRDADKLPSCGALQFFTGSVNADIRTLCSLMISVSDNTATNLLLRRFGLETLNREMAGCGIVHSHLERVLFDAEASAKGLENRVTPAEMGTLLAEIAGHRFVSEQVSREMEALLLTQQVGHKIPGYLPENVGVAHKTGEDSGITNDVGIVYAGKPFAVCFLSNETDVPETERAIREISLWLTRENTERA